MTFSPVPDVRWLHSLYAKNLNEIGLYRLSLRR